ncbi:MAG: acyl-CoA dehydratase activase-related protein [Oscillospiraceae bacterium]|nr:acyl-CoA dehydratase activase-related protein [Oscillospiraceae bacterium]
MTIGIPKALLYYRYGVMWEVFFTALGCKILIGPDTGRAIMEEGIALSAGECCLPSKIFLGHAANLIGKCDRILVPRFERTAADEEFCVRFWGLPDVVRGTLPGADILSYNLAGDERAGFIKLGAQLGFGLTKTLRAYQKAKKAQQNADAAAMARQNLLLSGGGMKILAAAHPYIIHDKYIGAPILRIMEDCGARPVFAEHCNRLLCRRRSKKLSRDLYWTVNKEILGAAVHLTGKISGVIFISAFPCGTDSLAAELALRRMRDIPAAHIILDEQSGEAGLQTRIECFTEILRERGKPSVAS